MYKKYPKNKALSVILGASPGQKIFLTLRSRTWNWGLEWALANLWYTMVHSEVRAPLYDGLGGCDWWTTPMAEAYGG